MKPDSAPSERLTSEPLNLLPQYRQKWLQFAWSTESIDQATAIEAIDAMYGRAKLEPPQIEFCANPLELRERVEFYLERDPEGLRQPWYYLLYSCWSEIRKRLDRPLWTNLYEHMGGELFDDLSQQLRDPLEKQLQRQWGTISHELGLHWHRGLEATLWEVMQYPTWLISNGALIDFCVTELGYTWQEEDWLIERGNTCDQEQWPLMQTIAAQVGWVVPLKQMCWVCDRPHKWAFDSAGQLHGQREPAIEYSGGFQVYAYHGLWLDDRFRKKPPSQWQPIWLCSRPNPPYERMIIQEIGYARLCQEYKIKIVDTWQNHTLLWFPLGGGRKVYLLKTVDEATGTNQYVEVPALTSVRAAIAWVNEQTGKE
ncbi:hypothetical protein H6F76_09030 [Leptolyngbya sp. FACHB-321]|uniref:DUF6745 domain-containing protein n=1 Tax=Leptolyngbya sp. FACHB-321 TaxID=2692807 RepID=UPI0016845A1C|nr:hypothetical protein [Leptolyngbya sp. FACHB-321]MBD2035170.1 hypothetical protein [Leptolyngbya sp. FACHB-321]